MSRPPPVELEETHRMFLPESGWSSAHACDFDPSRAPSVAAWMGSFEEFGRELAKRTSVSVRMREHLGGLDKPGLATEAVENQRAEHKLRDVLATLIRDPARVGALLRSLDSSLFARDREWREILTELQRRSSDYDEHKKLALVKYRQYLLHRQDELGRLWRARRAKAPSEAEAPGGTDSHASTDRTIAHFEKHRAEREFEKLVRIPRGRAVRVEAIPSDRFTLRLASHVFRIVLDGRATILDENGQRMPLRDGRNMVGRALYNDVVVDAEFADVSRRHLVVEVANGIVVSLTDLSSEGTYVPRQRASVAVSSDDA